MKRKRGRAKQNPILSPVCNVDEVIQSVVHANTHEELGLDDFGNCEVDHRMENELPEKRCECTKNKRVAEPLVEDTNLSKKARGKLVNLSREDCARVQPISDAGQVLDERTQQIESVLSHQFLQCKDPELRAALAVIRKTMVMDAAAPFNEPVDPVALGIPDYLEVIETPMDFGTICNNLENGIKYKNSEEVLRDVQLIWENCCKYNNKGHYILELMKRVKKKFMLLWTGFGLSMDQQPETNGSYQPSLRYSQSYQPQKRPFHHQLRSAHRQFSQPLACKNVNSLGSTSTEAATGRNDLCGHWCPHCQVDHTDCNVTHPQQTQFQLQQHQPHRPHQQPCYCHQTFSQQKQMDVCQPQYHLHHQPSTNCGQPYQSQKRSYHLISDAGNCSYAFSGGKHYPSCPEPSEIRFSKHGTVFPMTDCIGHHQQYQSSSGYGQQHQPLVEACSGMLGSRKQTNGFAKLPAGTEMGNAGEEFQSPPPADSMIRCTRRRSTKCPADDMTNINHQQKDQIAKINFQSKQLSLNYAQVESCGVLGSSSPTPTISDKLYAGIELDSSDDFHSPPSPESIISSGKRGPTTYPTDATPDITSHQQQDQISLSQMLPQKGPCEGLPCPSQSQPSHPQAPQAMSSAGTVKVKTKTRGRGPTRCLDVWNSEDRIPIATNEFGQPIGLEANKFIFFLGTIARNGHIAPLNYINWKAVPDENKERMWQLVKSKFDIDPQSKASTLKSIGTKWKNWKALLKANHYNVHETDEERLVDCNDRVQPNQWRVLVSFWNSTEAKVRSDTNKANRLKYTSTHACGSKSFARVLEEQRVKRSGGKEPTQSDLYIATRTHKDGRTVNEASSAIISQHHDDAQQPGTLQKDTAQDDISVQVMGDGHGCTLNSETGPTLSKLNSPKSRPVGAVRTVPEANAEVCELKEKMAVIEQTCAQMAAQIATMMSIIQRKFSEDDPPNADASGNSERSERSLSSRHGVPSLQRSTTRTGKKPKPRANISKKGSA